MMTTLPLPAGPAEPPVGGLQPKPSLTRSSGASKENSDSFASTLDDVRGKKDVPNRVDRSRAKANRDAKPAKDGRTSSEKPGDPDNLATAAAEGKPTKDPSAVPSTPKSTAAPIDVKSATRTSEDGASQALPKAAQTHGVKAVLETANRSNTGKGADAEADPKATIGAETSGAKAAAVKGAAGIEQAASSKATSGGMAASAADRGGADFPETGARLREAAANKTSDGETRSIEGSGGDKASTRGAVALQTEQTTGDRAFSDRERSSDQALRQGPNLSKGGNPKGSPRETGVAENEGGRTEGREASARPNQSGDRPGEAGRTFSDALRESTTPPAKDDTGPMAPRPSALDGSSVFSTPSAGPKTAAGTAAGAATANAAAPTAESFAQDNFHQLVERALFSVKGGQSEARIALKPDHMGHVRMQIVTEHQAVSIKIVTESPVARDLIDANAHQLRSELQQQGLNVQSIEVAVSDGDQDAYRGARQRDAFLRHMNARGTLPAEEESPSPTFGAADRATGGTSAVGIDYFA